MLRQMQLSERQRVRDRIQSADEDQQRDADQFAFVLGRVGIQRELMTAAAR